MRNLTELTAYRLEFIDTMNLLQHLITNTLTEEYMCCKNDGWFQTHFPTLGGSMPTHITELYGWEHAFLDLEYLKRTPTWLEMNVLRKFYWYDSEPVIQIHPKRSEYVNFNHYRLHLWKNSHFDFELPPIEQVLNKFEITSLDCQKPVSKYGKINDWKYVAIICNQRWATWEEVCEIKQEYFEPEETALQFHTGNANLDENSKHILILWDAKNIPLPDKHIV